MSQSKSEDGARRPEGPGRTPLHELMDIRPTDVSGGRGRVELVVGPQHLRHGGILHGGVFATLMDTVLGMSTASVAPEGHDVVTVQLNVNFIRAVALGETVVATGEVQHAGRRTAVARGELRTSTGELAATGSGTFMFLPPGGLAMGGSGPATRTQTGLDPSPKS